MNTCSIPGCDRPHKARGWCQTHYSRWREWGDPLHVPYSKDRAPVAEPQGAVGMGEVRCGDCGARLGTIRPDGSPWAAYERHTCEERK